MNEVLFIKAWRTLIYEQGVNPHHVGVISLINEYSLRYEEPMDDTDQIFRKSFADHKNGNIDKAAEGYQQVLSVQPYHPSALHLLGLIRYYQGKSKDAIPLIEKSLELVTDDLQWQVNYGDILAKTGNHEKAISAYQNALEIDPNSVVAQSSLGDIYFELNEFKEASKIYFQILCDCPRDYSYTMKYSDSLKAVGKVTEAENFLKWAKNETKTKSPEEKSNGKISRNPNRLQSRKVN